MSEVIFLGLSPRLSFIVFHRAFVKHGCMKISCGTHSGIHVCGGRMRGIGHLVQEKSVWEDVCGQYKKALRQNLNDTQMSAQAGTLRNASFGGGW